MKIFKGISFILCVILLMPCLGYSEESIFFSQYLNKTFLLDQPDESVIDGISKHDDLNGLNVTITNVSDENIDQAFQALEKASILDDPLLKALFIGLAVVAVIIALQSMETGN